MGTSGPTDPHFASADASMQSSAPLGVTTSGIDPQLLQQTKHEIRQLVREIQELSQNDVSPDQYYEQFLRRIVQALAAHGAAFWSLNETGLKLEYQINLPRAALLDEPRLQQQHALLLQNVLASGQPTLVPPQSGASGDGEAANPTDFLLVLAVIRVNQDVRGVIEVFQRPGGGPTTQRGYLRFLVQMSEAAGDFLRNRRLRHLGDRQTLWENLEQFLESVYRGLDVQETAFTVVNESRRLIGCDRVSLTLRHGRRQRVISVSGLDCLDRRAEQIQRLASLAEVVLRTRQPLWYLGGQSPLAPQLEAPLHAYLDQSHATWLCVVPLTRATTRNDDLGGGTDAGPSDSSEVDSSEILGALIIEQLEDTHVHEGFRERIETVARHSATALTNALDHETVFLMPLWRALGRARWVIQARTLPKTLCLVTVLLLFATGLAVLPADFELGARGKLQPAVRRNVFAALDGVVVEVPVRHEQPVVEGEILARLTNNSLEVEISNLLGRKRAIRERIRSVKRSQLNAGLRIEEQNRLDGELLELLQIEMGVDRELALERQRQQLLLIRSPMKGQVVTWDVQETLLRRPVRVGQVLMTVVDPQGEWELELYMPERNMGHLRRAARATESPLATTFVLASHPDRRFRGAIREIDRLAEMHGEAGNSVRLRVVVDKTDLPELRAGTTVFAKVHCGRRALGYVVFRELFETAYRKMFVWFA